MAIFRYSFMVLALVVNISALGNFPSRKTWWAKEITPDIYVAGRLTESQVKYASEDGFKSIIAVFAYNATDEIGGEIIPNADQLDNLATNVCGMYYAHVLAAGEEWARIETVERFTAILQDAPPPYLIPSYIAASSTFIALAYLANQTKHVANFTPRVDTADFFGISSTMGFVYDTPVETKLVSDITGQPVVTNPPLTELALSDWPYTFWLVKPFHKNVYISGQIRSNYVEMLGKARFKVFINLRRGVTTPPRNEPSQEEVTLLNIQDGTGTYDGTRRQSEQRLLQTRIDPDKPNEYIGLGSEVNYESRNPLEYGDAIGYNETMQRLDFQNNIPGAVYTHTPIGGQYKYTTEMWAAYKDVWMDTVKTNQSVLFSSRTGYRATIAALLTIGVLENRNSTWALTYAKERGFNFEQGEDSSVVQLFTDVLDQIGHPISCGNTLVMSSPIASMLLFGFSITILCISEKWQLMC